MRAVNFLLLTVFLFSSSTGAVEMIANPSVPAASLTSREARSLFQMRTSSWSDGTPVRIYVLADGNALHREFTKKKLKLFSYRLRRVWDRHLFTGTGKVPHTVDSVSEMVNKISSVTGAVGYADSESIIPEVKRIEIK